MVLLKPSTLEQEYVYLSKQLPRSSDYDLQTAKRYKVSKLNMFPKIHHLLCCRQGGKK